MAVEAPNVRSNSRETQRTRKVGAAGAARWALAGAVCAGGIWALVLTVAFARLKLGVNPEDAAYALDASLLFGGAGVCIGLVTGVAVGLIRGGNQREWVALVLGLLGVLFGVIGGGLSVPAAFALGAWLHPIAASALAWALAGFIAGLIGHDWSQWANPPEDAEEDADTPPPRRVEWILRQRQRRLRDWPLFRVLPVLTVSAFVLVIAAALAPSDTALALAAVGVSGLAVALVLHVQESRLGALDARLRRLERRFRGAPEEDA